MPNFEKREIESALLQKGFVATEGGSHTTYTFEPEHTLNTVATWVSRGSDRTIDDGRVSDMADQLNLTNQEFADLVQCPMEGDQYRRILIERGVIEGEVSEPSKPSARNFSDRQVSKIQGVLEHRMIENFKPRHGRIHGKIEDGQLEVEEVEVLDEDGILEEAGVDIDV